jgi:hypothetical protein
MDDQSPAIVIDSAYLDQLGLEQLSPEDKEALLGYIQEELQLRVGEALSDNLSDDQIDEFGEIMEKGDQQSATVWLSQNCPNYKEVVQQQVEQIRQGLIENRDNILAGGLHQLEEGEDEEEEESDGPEISL